MTFGVFGTCIDGWAGAPVRNCTASGQYSVEVANPCLRTHQSIYIVFAQIVVDINREALPGRLGSERRVARNARGCTGSARYLPAGFLWRRQS